MRHEHDFDVDTALSTDALAELDRQGLSRRQFLKGTGALVVAFGAADLAGRFGLVPDAALAQGGNTPQTLDSWIAVGGDGRITVYTGRADMGQGMATVQTQLAAEELSVPISRIRLVQCDTAMTPDQGTSSGSQAHPVNFNNENLAQACATAREALVGMAAQRLGVPAAQLTVADGVVSVRGDASKKATYAELVGGKRFDMTIQRNAKRKPQSEWTVLGTSVPRLEMADLVTGKYAFAHNVRVPGMLHGRVVRPPTTGATLASVDESSIANMPGLVTVVVKKNFVGVVCDKPWQAIKAAEALKVTWTPGPNLPRKDAFTSYMRNHPGRRDQFSVNSKDVEATLASASSRVKATYEYPYQMHGSMGSSCAVADVRGGKATVWSATQAVYPLRNTVAMVLGLQPADVRVIYTRGSGCYGLNGADAASYDAALMSQAVGKPVRVQLSRKDEMVWGENYGLPFAVDQEVGLDANGTIVAWNVETWSAQLGNRPGMNAPGNVASGMLAGFAPAAVQPRAQAPDVTNWDNGNNAVPAYVKGVVGGKAGGTGVVASERVLTHTVPSPFLTGPLRSPARLQNAFAQECFMDEVAAQVKADPVEYRLRHLADPRLKEVVTAAAKTTNWDTRPSPKPGNPRTGLV